MMLRKLDFTFSRTTSTDPGPPEHQNISRVDCFAVTPSILIVRSSVVYSDVARSF